MGDASADCGQAELCELVSEEVPLRLGWSEAGEGYVGDGGGSDCWRRWWFRTGDTDC